MNKCIIKRICDSLPSDEDVEALIPSSKFPTGVLETQGSFSKPEKLSDCFCLLISIYFVGGLLLQQEVTLEMYHYCWHCLFSYYFPGNKYGPSQEQRLISEMALVRILVSTQKVMCFEESPLSPRAFISSSTVIYIYGTQALPFSKHLREGGSLGR